MENFFSGIFTLDEVGCCAWFLGGNLKVAST